jgi:hypothetical protein
MIRLFLPVLLAATAPVAASGDILPADPVLQILMLGEAAQERDDHGAMLDSAEILRVLGATPAEGQDDMAAQWTKDAHDHGVTRFGPAFRGRALGPAYRRGFLGARGTVTVHQLFLAGQRARISVAPKRGASHLSMRVQGADGNILCVKTVGEAQADCDWLPLFTDRYDIVIENAGPAPAAFYLIVR